MRFLCSSAFVTHMQCQSGKLLNHINMNVMPQNFCVHLHFILWCSLLVPFTSNKSVFYCGTAKSQVHTISCSYDFPSSDNICIPVECLLTLLQSACIPRFHLITNTTPNCYCSFQGNSDRHQHHIPYNCTYAMLLHS
jgi:hypothetical protein